MTANTQDQQDGLIVAGRCEFLTFHVGGEDYGVDIQKVQEIRSYGGVTAIANTPAFIKGVSNLRGIIVPIVDLRIKFGMPAPSYDAFTVVIVLSLAERVIGIVVDGVSDVLALQSEEMRPAPAFGAMVDTSHVRGIGTRDGRMIMLLDIERMMSGADMGLCAARAA